MTANAVSAERGPSDALMAVPPDREMQSRLALVDRPTETERSITALEAHISGEIGSAAGWETMIALADLRL